MSTMEILICNDCGKEFTKLAKLQRHIREIHQNLKPFQCEVCFKEFKRKFHLTRHMVTHSDNPKPFSCEIENCNQRFSNKHHLTRHVKIIHDQERYRCKECDITYKKKNSYQQHLKEMHSTFDRQETLDTSFTTDDIFELPLYYVDPIQKKVKKEFNQTDDQIGDIFNITTPKEEYQHDFIDFDFHRYLNDDKEFKCDQQEKEVMKTKSKKEIFKCPHENCFKSYSLLTGLGLHIRKSHLKIKTRKFKQFKSDSQLLSVSQNNLTSNIESAGSPDSMPERSVFDELQDYDYHSFNYVNDEDYTNFLSNSSPVNDLSYKLDLLDEF